MVLVFANPGREDWRISNYSMYVIKLVRIILIFLKKLTLSLTIKGGKRNISRGIHM